MKVHIVDYGMGNIFSVQKKLLKETASVTISSNASDISKADKVILVGVGHFKKAMDNLHDLNLIEPLNNFAKIKKKPILGICLGMQLMATCSQEGGKIDGLNWVDAEVNKFKTTDSLKFKIPHIGWNSVMQMKDSRLTQGLSHNEEFYFVHSYFVKPKSEDLILHRTSYIQNFCSAFEKDNIFGVQYHPEKSHDAGQLILQNFLNL